MWFRKSLSKYVYLEALLLFYYFADDWNLFYFVFSFNDIPEKQTISTCNILGFWSKVEYFCVSCFSGSLDRWHVCIEFWIIQHSDNIHIDLQCILTYIIILNNLYGFCLQIYFILKYRVTVSLLTYSFLSKMPTKTRAIFTIELKMIHILIVYMCIYM